MATIFDLQAKNRSKTRVIVICFILFFLWLGLGMDLALYFLKGSRDKGQYRSEYSTAPYAQSYASQQAPRRPFYPVFAIVISVVGAGVAWWSMSNAAETILKAMMAEPAESDRSQAERTLINIVEEMSIASGLKPPQVWIIPDDDPNALATGLEDGDYHIAVTRGLMRTLSRDELQGVVAHEIAHLKNEDTRLMTCLTVLVGMAALISEFVARVRFFNLGGGSRDSDSDSSDTKIGIVIFVLWLMTALIAPFVTRLMTLMVGREREYLADASAAQFTRNPEALARALEKIGYADAPTQSVRPASAQLCIASPTAADLGEDEGWFATHPPIRKRIARLRSMGNASEFQDTQRMQL